MSASTSSIRTAAPWHLWVVGVVLLLLYAIGAYDYVLTQAQDTAYFESQGYGPQQVDYFTDYPVVPLVFWTVNIVAGVAAAVLLLLRSRWSLAAVATAAVAQLCLQAITFGFMDRWSVLGPRLSLQDLGVLLLTFLMWAYCHRMRRRNVLT